MTESELEPDDAGPEEGVDECPADDQLDTLGPETGCEQIEVEDDGQPLGFPELDERGEG